MIVRPNTGVRPFVPERGAALMPLILVFAGLVVMTGLAFASISISHSIAVEGEYGASRALHYAEAGLNDALMRVVRDRNYLCTTEDCYTIDLASNGCANGTACVWVRVQEGASSTGRLITARGKSGGNERVLERSFFFDEPMNGLVSNVIWCEQYEDTAVRPYCRAAASTTGGGP